MWASFAVTSQNATVMATAYGKCLVTMERHEICGWRTWTDTVFWLMATSCIRKHWAYRKPSAGGSLGQVTPSHLLRVRNGYKDSGKKFRLKKVKISGEAASYSPCVNGYVFSSIEITEFT